MAKRQAAAPKQPAKDTDGSDEYGRFESLTKGLLSVSKKESDEQRALEHERARRRVGSED